MQQMGHYTLSPQQPLRVAHEAAMTPCLDLTTAPHQPPIYARLGPNRGTCSGDRSPSTDGPGPPTFAQLPQQAPFLPRSNEGHGNGMAKHQDQDEGPPTQRGKKNRKDRHRPANSASVAAADHPGTQPQQDRSGHFHELMESPCTNHDYPINHIYKDGQLLKHLLR